MRALGLLFVMAVGGPHCGRSSPAPAPPAPPASKPQPAAAAAAAAESAPECKAITPFFWEVGDANDAVASGSVGGDAFTATTTMPIASASKWLWGAYVVERFKLAPGAIDLPAMTMRSGYTGFTECLLAPTVGRCFEAGHNARHDPADDGFFAYGGGHFQKYAVDLGLGTKTNEALATEIASQLGTDLGIAYVTPQPAGGARMAPGHYARFLRKIVKGSLAIHGRLGEAAVCTLPRKCPKAHESPVPEEWHYSYGHWVEDDPGAGDGSFSSPGLFGFYPWIDAKKDLYGIVARHDAKDLRAAPAESAYWKSVLCGRAIRKAYVTHR